MQGLACRSIEPGPCFSTGFDYKARFRAARRECCLVGLLARSDTLFSFQNRWRDPPFRPRWPIAWRWPPAGDCSKMPKLKTKSGAKKRFKITGTGKVVYAQRGKRHGMIKRTPKQIRNLRGTSVMFKSDGDNIIKFFLPNG
jgi:large subunit ribosomal protein L35